MMQAQTMDSRTKKRSERLEQLIRIYESGQVSELMDQTLDKLFSVEAATVQVILMSYVLICLSSKKFTA